MGCGSPEMERVHCVVPGGESDPCFSDQELDFSPRAALHLCPQGPDHMMHGKKECGFIPG